MQLDYGVARAWRGLMGMILLLGLTALGAVSASAQQAAAGTPEAAVQAVITQSNAEAAQAIAAGDPTVMRDTSTDAYYQQVVALLTQMLANPVNGGVTSATLDDLTWGPTTINGATATATTFENWSFGFADGSTMQTGRERNVYTLVQQGGAWKVQADDHPDE